VNQANQLPSTLSASSRWRFTPWLLIVIISCVVLWYWQVSLEDHQREVEKDFENNVAHATELFKERFTFYQNPAYAGKGLFNSSEEVTAPEWHRFMDALRIGSNYSGMQSVFFAGFEHRDGKGLDSLHQADAAKLAEMPAQERGFSVLVVHRHPKKKEGNIIGYDLASETVTLQALLRSYSLNRAILTSVFTDPLSGQKIVRQVLPVTNSSAILNKDKGSGKLIQGWLVINVDVKRWLDRFAREASDSNFSFNIREKGGDIFYDNRVRADRAKYHQRNELNVGGHTWVMAFSSTQPFEQRRNNPFINLFPLSVMLFIGILLLVIRGMQGNERRAEAIAGRMTEQLRLSEARYREMFEANKAVELLIEPATGDIVDANQAAENYYGYSRQALQQMNISDINTLSEDEIKAEMERAAEERRSHFLFRHRHATGEVRDVEVHSGPIEVEGKRLLYSIVHDVTARMEGEQALRESEERYHSIIDTTSEGYWLVELASLKILEVNDALCRMLGYEREEMIGRQPFEFADEENRKIFAYQATQHTVSRQRSYEIVLKHKNGQDVIVRINATNMPHGERKPVEAFAFITDITEWKRTEEQLRIAATFFDTTSEAITVTDCDNRIVAVNPAFTMITGYSEEEALGRDPSFLSSGRNNAAFYRSMWDTLMRMGRWQGEIWNRRKNGEIYPEWLSIVAIRDDKGVVNQYMAVFSDITKRKKDEEKIWRQANYDALTGLPNRNLFKDRLDQAMHAAHREKSRLALMFIDLDRFKWVNDTLGHASGDLLLQETARRLKRCVRETDTVARLGGDEFTILLNDVHSTGNVDRISEALLSCMSEPFDLDGKEAFVSGSIGITLYPGDAENMEQLLGNADAAMYSAKASGRNIFRYYTQEMNEATQRRLMLEADLRRVLERDELLLYYQPIVDGYGNVAGAEALLRWQHPEYGFIAPDEFIPLAEEVGMIVPIEQWVMRKACTDAVRFQACDQSSFFMSVNVSSVQCKSDQCRHVLAEVLNESGLNPDCLKLEITERVMMENTESVIALLREVRAMGVRLAVDDFGTGYSSLSYLKQFPIDVLKIDRAFIEGLPDDRDNVALVEAIVAMAHSLNLQVVGEGVENADQLVFLRSLGCDLIQGFHFSHPLPADDFIAYLNNH